MAIIQKKGENIVIKRPFTFLATWRSLPPYELLSYILMYTSMPMLAYGLQPYTPMTVRTILLTIITLYAGFFAALIWNDITDETIDTIVHPDRPLPTKRITPKKFFTIALIFSAITFLSAYLLSIWCFLLVGAAALFVTIHNKYLRKMVKIPAYSILLTPLQWITVPLFGFVAIWTTTPITGDIYFSVPLIGSISFNTSDIPLLIVLVLFIYFTDNAHDIAEGIHDLEGDKKLGIQTYASSFGPTNAARISYTMLIISGILGILLFYITILSPLFLILFLISWFYTLWYSSKLFTTSKSALKEISLQVGRKNYDYFLFSFNFIFIDIAVQLISQHLSLTF